MAKLAEFDRYMSYLCEVLRHADRHESLVDYSRGLMLPIERKSVEPLAAHTDPWHVRAKHQSLHHFVAKSAWSDGAVLGRVRDWVVPALGLEGGCYWIVDDTGFPKKGGCSVGVARQYCGQLGKQDNCQIAVSLSLASPQGSVPITWQLYLPQAWAEDRPRRAKAGVPAEVEFATKPQIALSQIKAAQDEEIPLGVVLADAGYGNETAFREELTRLGLVYCVGIQSVTSVWAPGTQPLPPKSRKKTGRPAKLLRRGRGHAPVKVSALAEQLPAEAWQSITWREATHTALSSRFAAVRIRPAHHDYWRARLREEQWLLMEWPKEEAEPTKYWLSTLSADTPLEDLVATAKMRWRIERDYQELKQEFGLSHYEGRGWRGFHHHATLCIAAYGFLLSQRLMHEGRKKNSARSKAPRLPQGYTPRGGRSHAAPRSRFDPYVAISHRTRDRKATRPLSVLWHREPMFMTQ